MAVAAADLSPACTSSRLKLCLHRLFTDAVTQLLSKPNAEVVFVLFVSISQVTCCEDRLRNDLYCVEWGVKLYSNSKLKLKS